MIVFFEPPFKCSCITKLKMLKCTRCKKIGINCNCQMEEIYGNQLGQAQTALERALKSYEGHHEIASVTELLSLMAGVVDPNKGSCSYDTSKMNGWKVDLRPNQEQSSNGSA